LKSAHFKLQKCTPPYLLSPRGEDEGEGVILKSTLTPTLSRQREREE